MLQIRSATVDQDAINCPQCGVGLPQSDNLTEQIGDTVSEIKEEIKDSVEDAGDHLTDVATDLQDKAEEAVALVDQQTESVRDTFVTDPHEEKLPDPFAKPAEMIPDKPTDPHEEAAIPTSSPIPAYTPKPRKVAADADPLPVHDTVTQSKASDKNGCGSF